LFRKTVAGHDTTSTALQWLALELARHPEIQEKMRKEIEQTIGLSTVPTYNDTKNLTYIRQVINENMRKNTIIPFVFKELGEDTVLSGGHKAAAHSTCFIDIYYVHHDPEVWPEPYEFKPERFEQTPQPCTFMPFSTGPRSCIGANFSLAEQTILITRILQQYTIELPQGLDGNSINQVLAGAVLQPDPSKFRIVMKPRK